MPYKFDFSQCVSEVKKVEVSPKGWKTPITVEYGIAQAHPYDTMRSVVWRVVGTTHTFTIYEHRLNIVSHGNYAKHFEEILTNFRLDYLSWFSNEEYREAEWKYDYEKEFGGLILPEEDADNESESE